MFIAPYLYLDQRHLAASLLSDRLLLPELDGHVVEVARHLEDILLRLLVVAL
jgi:hypothetical protein